MTSRRHLAIAVVALAAATGLVACQGTTPTPTGSADPTTSPTETATPTPEPTAGAIPELTPPTFETAQSEGEAIEQAVEAVNAFYVAVSYLYNAHGEHAERIEDFASGSALAFQEETIQRVAEEESRVEGAPVVVDVILGTATESETSGETVAFGYVDMTACLDLSNYTVFNADGTERDLGPQERGHAQFASNFYPESGRWIVEMEEVVEGSC